MSTDTPEVKEKEVAGWPGWTKVQLGSSRRYVSPGGVEISASRFLRLSQQYKGQKYIPESSLLEDLKLHDPDYNKNPKGFMGSVLSTKTRAKSKAGNQESENQEPEAMEYGDLVKDLEPRTKSRTGSKKHPRPSQVALSIGFKQLTLLITAVIFANIMKDNRFAMSEQEATALGIALANLLEPTDWNEKYGWLVADTGDWQMIGYVLGGYIVRVYGAVKEKADARRAHGGIHQPTSSGAGEPGSTNGQYQFVPHSRPSPVGVTQSTRNG